MENKLISITARPVGSSLVENEIVSQVSITETSSGVIIDPVQLSQVSITETSSAVNTNQIIETIDYSFNTNVILAGYGEESVPSSGLFLRPDYNNNIVTPFETVSKVYTKTFNEQFSKSDQIQFLLNKANTELINTSDLSILIVDFGRVFTEIQVLTDAAAVSLEKPLTDSSLINDLLTSDYSATKLDVLAATDNFSTLVDFTRQFIDSITSTDDVLGEANIDDDQIAYFNKVLVDGTTLNDVLILTASFIREFADTSAISDQTQLLLNQAHNELISTSDLSTLVLSKLLTESQVLTDAAAVSLEKPLTDSLLIDDLFINDYSGTKLDVLAAIDNFSTLVDYKPQFTDSITSTDDVLGEANIDDDQIAYFNKVLVDITTLNDILILTASFIREFADTSAISDQTQFLLNTINTDLISTSDLSTLLVDFNRVFTESQVITDVSVVSLEKTVLDSSILNDLFTSDYSGTKLDVLATVDSSIFDFTQQLSDVITTTDDVLGEANIDDDQIAYFNKVLVDGTTLSDVLILTASFIREFADTSAISDQAQFLLNQAHNELINTSDLSTLVLSKSLIESQVLTDVLVASLEKPLIDSSLINDLFINDYSSTKLDVLAATDNFSTLVDFTRQFIDVITSTDDVLGEANIDDDQIAYFNKVLVDGTTLSDVLILTASFIREFADTSAISDQAQFLLNTINTDLTSTSDLSTLVLSKSLIESQVLTDVSAASLEKTLTDSSLINDLLTSDYSGTKLDVLATTDNFSTLVDFKQQFTDVITTTDDVLGEANIDDDQIAYFNKVLVDSTTLSDVLILTASFIREFTDPSTISDQAQFLLNTINTDLISTSDLSTLVLSKSLTESQVLTDAAVASLQKTVLDSSTVNDLLTSDYSGTKLDILAATDTFSSLVDFKQQFTDLVTTTDDVLGEANIDDDQIAYFNKVIADIITSVQDVIKLDLIFGRTLVDTVTNSETKTANIQSFFLSDYVQPGYVGTNLTL